MTHIILQETKKEKDRKLSEKEAVIAEQSQKMENMAIEFSDMLKVRFQWINDLQKGNFG
jgi:flagellar hook-basal body complex protein FliE